MSKINCDLVVDEKTAEILQELLTDYGKTVLIKNNFSNQICFYYADFGGSYNIDIPIEGVYGGIKTVINHIEVENE